MIPPAPPLPIDDPFLPENDTWAERQRRQRTLRLLMMFLMMLLLMDGDPPNQHQNHLKENARLRGGHYKKKRDGWGSTVVAEEGVWTLRREIDEMLSGGSWGREGDVVESEGGEGATKGETDGEDETMVLTYPRNASGYYRGFWSWKEWKESDEEEVELEGDDTSNALKQLTDRATTAGVYLLPKGIVINANDGNYTKISFSHSLQPTSSSSSSSSVVESAATMPKATPSTLPASSSIPLPTGGGKTALQIYQKSIPGMSEISLIDGFIKIYDGTTNVSLLSPRRDWLLRAKGVMIHGLGVLSLVANTELGRRVFVIPGQGGNATGSMEEESVPGEVSKEMEDEIFLKEAVSADKSSNDSETRQLIRSQLNHLLSSKSPTDQQKVLDLIRDHAISLTSNNSTPWTPLFSSDPPHRHLLSSPNPTIISYPFIPDDKQSSLRSFFSTTRHIPLREQNLQKSSQSCSFLISLHATPTPIAPSTLTSLLEQRERHILQASPSQPSTPSPLLPPNPPAHIPELFVTSLSGDLTSPDCQFQFNITATALRINWESTTSKAINYSFYMMLTCLTQIVVLLRQLLHTQAPSAATRVSLLCVGWQTVIDAILCIGHILLCFLMQPLFTAFASVAFFKLLIFCVIEMKYMAIVLQARHAGMNWGAERLRRQVTLLHVRFYTVLFLTLSAFWYAAKDHLGGALLMLYSFWVPQILYNVYTEAKRPLHTHYVYGMSLTRLVAPLYMFCMKNNFLREAQPEFPRDVVMCQLVVLWVGVQAGVLILQGRYGARFMIPARFLPPKFDYSRPIPPSLLPSPPPTPTSTPTSPPPLPTPTPSSSTTSTTTRNRINGRTSSSSHHHHSPRIRSGTTQEVPVPAAAPTLDCVICYSPINVHDRRGYMLAPCDHIFHRECLEQWMDVKMECPICRTDLPPI